MLLCIKSFCHVTVNTMIMNVVAVDIVDIEAVGNVFWHKKR